MVVEAAAEEVAVVEAAAAVVAAASPVAAAVAVEAAAGVAASPAVAAAGVEAAACAAFPAAVEAAAAVRGFSGGRSGDERRSGRSFSPGNSGGGSRGGCLRRSATAVVETRQQQPVPFRRSSGSRCELRSARRERRWTSRSFGRRFAAAIVDRPLAAPRLGNNLPGMSGRDSNRSGNDGMRLGSRHTGDGGIRDGRAVAMVADRNFGSRDGNGPSAARIGDRRGDGGPGNGPRDGDRALEMVAAMVTAVSATVGDGDAHGEAPRWKSTVRRPRRS